MSKASRSGKAILVGDYRQLPPYGVDTGDKDEVIKELALRDYLPRRGLDASYAMELEARGGENASIYERSRRKLQALLSAGRIEEYKTSPFETLWEHVPGLFD